MGLDKDNKFDYYYYYYYYYRLCEVIGYVGIVLARFDCRWIQLSSSKKIHIPMVSVETCANQTLGGYLLLNFGCISQKTAKHNQIPPAP